MTEAVTVLERRDGLVLFLSYFIAGLGRIDAHLFKIYNILLIQTGLKKGGEHV